MANELLGYRVTVALTCPASQGKPRTKQTQDLWGANGTIMPKAEADGVANSARQALQMVELGMLAPPGLDPGQSNLAFNISVQPVYAEIVNKQLTGKLTDKA